MNVSSLQKKMFTAKSLALLFLIGLLSLAFFVFDAKAAVVSPVSTSGSATVTTTWHILFSFTTSTDDSSMVFGFSSSTNGTTWSPTTSVATSSGTFFDFNKLATNTLYYFRAGAGDAVSSSSWPFASTTAYTWADIPGTPIISGITVQGFTVLINSSTNPAATTYIIRDTASSTRTLYLQDDHTWGTATATFVYTALGPVTGTTTILVATNTLHRISVAAVNGAGVTTSYSTAAADFYTLATAPAIPTVTSANPQQLTIVINAGSNPTAASTTFVVRDTVSSTQTKYLQSNSTWDLTTSTFTYAQLGGASGTTTIGLATSSPHIISVAAINGDSSATTSYGSTLVISTVPNTPTTTLSVIALTSFTVTINSSTNPTSTTYIVRDTGGSTVKYLQTDHTWGTTTATISFAFVGGLVSTSTIGLTANTPHVISVAAVSSDNTATSSYSATASNYTLANVPSSVVLTAEANGFTLTWSGDATQYWVIDESANANSGLIASTNYSVGGINCGVSRTFSVSGRNGDGVATATSTSVTGTTGACGSGAVISAPTVSAVPATPAVPGVSPAVPATPASVSLPSSASPVAVFVHTLGIGSKGAEVKQLQQTLRELGFFKHPTNTGLFGPATKAAVVAFQKAQGFKTAPGVVGPATREALNSESGVSAGESAPAPVAPAPVSVGEFVSNLRLGSKGEEVRMLQAKLRELGFFNHPTDTGVFGGVTRAAVVAFQKDQGFATAPGVVGPATRAALNNL